MSSISPGLPMSEFTCTGCGTVMGVAVPKADLINQPKISMVILMHERPSVCPNCQKMFTVVITSVDDDGMKLAFVELKSKPPEASSQSKLVVMPTASEGGIQ